MGKKATLFDDKADSGPTKPKEAKFLDKLKDLDDKIAAAINKVKTLKAEKAKLEDKVAALESALAEKDNELERLSSEKTDVKGQIETLLSELESLED